MGIRFGCDLSWKVKRVENANVIVISKDPLVTLSFGPMNSKIKLLGQLSPMKLRKTGMYKSGLKSKYVTLAGFNALKVRGYSKDNSDIRRLDYFFIHDSKLCGMSFSIYPKDRWEDARPVITALTESIEVIE